MTSLITSSTETLDRAAVHGGAIRISSRFRLRISGGDALRYLNGQVSNDVRKLLSGDTQSACILSAKGKLDAVVDVWCDADSFIIEAPEELGETLALRLEKYVVADDVEISAEQEISEWHVFGEAALAKLADSKPLRKVSRIGYAGADFAESDESAIDASGIVEITDSDAEAIRVSLGVPRWGFELGPDTLPAEAGLDRTAVDFHKGCYIGQETVSRIQSVGRVNRQLFKFHSPVRDRSLKGLSIFRSTDPAEAKPLGIVTSHVGLGEESIGLCFVKRETDVLAPTEARDHTQQFALTLSSL